METIYVLDMKGITVITGIIFFFIIGLASNASVMICKRIASVLCIFAILLIFYYSAWGRKTSTLHEFTMYVSYSDEFWREMFMNALLYIPLGWTLPFAIENYFISVLLAFLLSCVVETWQYFAGTGIAQGTDVMMNIVGVMLGGLCFVIVRRKKHPIN